MYEIEYHLLCSYPGRGDYIEIVNTWFEEYPNAYRIKNSLRDWEKRFKSFGYRTRLLEIVIKKI